MMLESEIIKYWNEMWYEKLLHPDKRIAPIFPYVPPEPPEST